MLRGSYHVASASLTDLEVLHPPTETDCEKNWLPIPNTNSFVYGWRPFTVGAIQSGTFVPTLKRETPWVFQHLRGSAVPFWVGSELWALTHYVEYTQPRKYFHCIVVLNDEYKPLRISLPFVFKAQGVEYCLGAHLVSPTSVEFAFSSWDDNPCLTTVPISQFQWVQV
jgi:hypothetical protein